MSSYDVNTILTFITRRSDITEEKFHHHWEKVHGPLVAPWALKHGFEYTQLHLPQNIRDTAKERERARTPYLEASRPYDGIAQFRVKDIDQFLAAFKDPYYTDVIRPDEANFIDVASTEPIGATILADGRPMVANGNAQVDTEKEMKMWQEFEAKQTQK